MNDALERISALLSIRKLSTKENGVRERCSTFSSENSMIEWRFRPFTSRASRSHVVPSPSQDCRYRPPRCVLREHEFLVLTVTPFFI